MNRDDNHKTHSSAKNEKFARTVFNDIRRGDLKRSLGRDLRELKAYYIDEEMQARLSRMNWFKRAFVFMAWLLKSLFYKLTPARRILVLCSMLFFIFGDITFTTDHIIISPNFRVYSFLFLLFVLMLELKDKLLAREELEAGRIVQAALLPSVNPDIPGWEVWLYTQSANEVGGDLVDYIKLDEERWGVALGDVAGKGLGAALFMAKLQATMRALVPEFISLADLGKHMNAILCRDGIPNRFATFCYMELRTRSGRVRMLNAGHFPPILIRKQKLSRLDPLAMAFGVTTKTAYTEQSVSLEPGELLLVYSDGLTEAVNETGEFFGEERLFRLLSTAQHTTASDVGALLLEEVKKFVGTTPASDDLSLVILRKLD